jgi:sRNA-binding carbon storage regulator CsrA
MTRLADGYGCLVLSRRSGEGVQIGQHVRVTVDSVVRGVATLMIDAPRAMRIERCALGGFDPSVRLWEVCAAALAEPDDGFVRSRIARRVREMVRVGEVVEVVVKSVIGRSVSLALIAPKTLAITRMNATSQMESR